VPTIAEREMPGAQLESEDTVTMRVRIDRWAMIGGGIAYHIYVPASDVPEWVRADAPGGRYYTTTSMGDGTTEQYYSLYYALLTREHSGMEQGEARLDRHLAHEAEVERLALQLLQKMYPETQGLTEYPILWIDGLRIPTGERVNTTRWTTIDTNP
jgi:hypothetical protein